MALLEWTADPTSASTALATRCSAGRKVGMACLIDEMMSSAGLVPSDFGRGERFDFGGSGVRFWLQPPLASPCSVA